jgi:orotate phosphoribosyltransferase
MADSYFNFEDRLRGLGVIEKGDFQTAAGATANQKINLEKVLEKDPQLAAEMAGVLAIRLSVYKPDLIVPVPAGANRWGKEVALHRKTEHAKLRWRDKQHGKLTFASKADRQKLLEAERIAIIDDVFTTGSSIKKVISHPEITGKVVVAGVIWNRSPLLTEPGFPLISVIDTFVPHREDDE